MINFEGYDAGVPDFALSAPGIAELPGLSAPGIVDLLDAGDLGAEPLFGTGGYHGDFNGVANCWYSSDGYVYDPAGHPLGAA